ncbi:MAG: hypothetical protein D6677_13650 [Calditrichaeota bacterium]|nr:MAG: hypothetical protein D6677_13650 [Calditrichota bacterium]
MRSIKIFLISVSMMFTALACGSKTEKADGSRPSDRDAPKEIRQTVLFDIQGIDTPAKGPFMVRAAVVNDTRTPALLIPNLVRKEGKGIDTTLAENRHMLKLRALPAGTRVEAQVYWKSYKLPARALLMDYKIVKKP